MFQWCLRSMLPIIESLAPLLLIVGLGWLLAHKGIIAEQQWGGFERVIYLVFFPALIVATLAVADLRAVPALGVAFSLVAAIALVGATLILLNPILNSAFNVDGPQFTSYFQGAIRWNTFVAIGLCASLYGPRGLTVVAVAVAAILPFVNVASVWVMRRYALNEKGGLQLLGLLKNPFIWSSLLGLAINLTGLPLPKSVVTSLDILGRAALGAALLLVGSGLKIGDMARPDAPMILTCALKLVALPVIAAAIARSFGINGPELGVIVICAAVPTAGAAYILARQMGGDARLMANIITTQTILSAVTLPVLLALLTR
jgi:malonate transporter